ncbi:hypothetical protein BOSEA31B_12949 [Hyphomicrobiales bacterium]|nr:hypothetical protein BOSEA31B_12949 [Hyphomicrobiales bacterium]CAH1698722.1 hypothetical protein BOSEA1005_11775 [Hyphomicrobiales bacterium]CAI0342370.1 hypothetical protein BO1005MUT1_180149 [Hyphomicrobiales bacterium]
MKYPQTNLPRQKLLKISNHPYYYNILYYGDLTNTKVLFRDTKSKYARTLRPDNLQEFPL